METVKKYYDWSRKEVVQLLRRVGSNFYQAKSEEGNYFVSGMFLKQICECDECQKGLIHLSDCQVHNEPHHLKGKCTCSPSYLNNALRADV